MAKPRTKTTFDMSGWTGPLDRLQNSGRESLARRMTVSGGRVFRDVAKVLASVSHARTQFKYNPASRGSHGQAGDQLADAIYLAFNEKLSNGDTFVYSVSWNDRKAWWGKLREFPHLIRYRFFYDEHGVYHTIKSQPLKNPIVVPARPFLGPTFDSQLANVREAMIARGKIELPKILRGE